MRERKFFAWLALAIAVGACQAELQQRFTVHDVASVQALLDSVAAEIRAGKAEAWSARFADDARFFAAGMHSLAGRTAIRSWGSQLPPVESFAFGPAEVHGDGGLAYGWSPVYLKFRGVPADTARQLVVFRRDADRGWKIQAVSINIRLPVSAEFTSQPKRR